LRSEFFYVGCFISSCHLYTKLFCCFCIQQEELVNKLAKKTGLAKAKAEGILKALGSTISHEVLTNNNDVAVPFIGVLAQKINMGREKNNLNGELMQPTPWRTIHFSPLTSFHRKSKEQASANARNTTD
jgi:nucleoid DNA-binding protein